MTDTEPAPGRRSLALVAVVAAVSIEAVLLVAVAVFFGVELMVGEASDLFTAVAVAVLALLVGVFLALCARGLWRGRRWARAPVMTWQLITILAVVPSLGPGRWWIAGGLLVPCLVAAIGLLLPSVVAATTNRAEPPVA